MTQVLRACLISPRTRLARHIFRHTALFCLEIRQGFLRQNALSDEKSAAQSAHCGILNRLLVRKKFRAVPVVHGRLLLPAKNEPKGCQFVVSVIHHSLIGNPSRPVTVQ